MLSAEGLRHAFGAVRVLDDITFTLAPGRTLAGLAKRINRRLPIESFATAEALSAVT